MKRIPLGQLSPGTTLENPLYHPGGAPLIAGGNVLTKHILERLGELGIDKVVELMPSEVAKFKRDAALKETAVDDLVAGSTLLKPMFDSRNRLLLEAGVPLSDQIIEGLRSKGHARVYQGRTPEETGAIAAEKFRKLLAGTAVKLKTPEFPEAPIEPDVAVVQSPEEFEPAAVERSIEEGEAEIEVAPEGEPLSSQFVEKPADVARSDEYKSTFQEKYVELKTRMKILLDMLQVFSATGLTSRGKLFETASDIVRALIYDRELVLNFVNIQEKRDYLIKHSLNVSLLTACIAAAEEYSQDQVFEVTLAALLSDIGMLKVAPRTVSHRGKLDAAAWREVKTHVLDNLSMAKAMSKMPKSLPVVLLQVHERFDGSGYLKGANSKRIHSYARMIAVADVYDALISNRPWREAYLPYKAMETVVRMVKDRKLDPDAVRSFLRYMSLFPIGSWVKLTKGYFGKVVASNVGNYYEPIVRVLYYDGRRLDEPQTIDLAKDKELKVVKAVSAEGLEEDIYTGF